MSKIKYLAQNAAKNSELMDENSDRFYFTEGFEEGFEAAFTFLREEATKKIEHLKQYEMMNERIFALKAYMDKMDEMLKEMK